MSDNTGFLIFIAICGLIAFIVIMNRRKLRQMGFDPDQMLSNVKYTCGHPNIDSPTTCNVGLKEGNIYILSTFNKTITGIEGSNVRNVTVEDESTFRNRVTLTRMALVGIFAFALTKRKKDELAYLTIEWSDGRFDHSTIFEYSGKGSLQKANTDRNKIIKGLQ